MLFQEHIIKNCDELRFGHVCNIAPQENAKQLQPHSPVAVCTCRFPNKARSLLDSIQAWKDMEEANAQAFSNRLQATFLRGSRPAVKQTSSPTENSRRMSTDSLRSLVSSPTRSNSAKRAFLVAR